MQPYRPLGTLYAAAALRAAGFSVAVFDPMLSNPDEGFTASYAEHSPRIVAIYEDDFNFLTKMCLTRMREVAWSIAEVAKKKHVPVIVHGSDATDHPELFLSHGVDYVLRGEAEQTLVGFVQLLSSKHLWAILMALCATTAAEKLYTALGGFRRTPPGTRCLNHRRILQTFSPIKRHGNLRMDISR